MKNKKLIIGIIIGIVVVVISILGLIIFNNIKDKETLNGNYMTKGEYYLHFIKEVNMYLNDYEEEDYESDKGEEIAANTMYEHYLIEKDQMKKLNKPVTREIVAQSLVRYMEFRTEHDVEILDINNCVDKQAIVDAVGMGIFELENGKFNANGYMTEDEVISAVEKMINIEMNSHYPENGWEDDDNEKKDPKVDWSGLDLTINGIKYNYPLKVSTFTNNGWIAESSEFEEILNKTIDENFLPSGDEDFFVGYNYVVLKRNDLQASVYFDTSVMNTKVTDASVIHFEIKRVNENSSDNFNFYGVDFSTSKEEIVDLFGTKNYTLTDNNNSFSYSYYGNTTENRPVALNFEIDKKTNKLIKFGISFN